MIKQPTPVFLLLYLAFANSLFAQVKIPEMSSYCQLTQSIGLTEIEIKYRRPSMRNRGVMGNLVSYDRVWRTGANECTSISFANDLWFNGMPVPAGTYCLFTIPNPSSWTIILNKNATQWGAFQYSDEEDQIRFEIEAISLEETVETFEIGFQNVDERSGDLRLEWENTAIKIKIESDVDAMVDASIQKMLAENSTNSWDYYFAATYYFRSEREIEKVMGWMEKSIALDPVYWVVFEYAEILKKINKNKEALLIAQEALEKAKQANDTRFAQNHIIPLIQLLEMD